MFFVHMDRVFFFFFQAEDGIRDRDVTGVQTCALPILSGLATDWPLSVNRRTIVRAALRQSGIVLAVALIMLVKAKWASRVGDVQLTDPVRSEERRVGKECRDVWAP